jgi:DNA-binding response OmpR family regulator
MSPTSGTGRAQGGLVRFRPRDPTILLVSDSRAARHEHADHLRAAGYTVHMADAHRTAMVILRDVDPSLTVIDLPPHERARLVDEARSLDPDAPVLLTDGLARSELLRAVEDRRRRDEERPPAA